jgi:hypothetical protein
MWQVTEMHSCNIEEVHSKGGNGKMSERKAGIFGKANAQKHSQLAQLYSNRLAE